MQFRDLMQLPYDAQNNVVQLAAIMDAVPNTPEPVAFQFYSEHGRFAEFRQRYGEVEISGLKWELVPESALTICAASRNPKFNAWVDTVEKRVEAFDIDGWACVDTRAPVVASWATNATWLTHPIFLSGEVAGTDAELHLVEGHTRFGILCGLLKAGIVSAHSTHSIWLGSRNDT